MEDAPGSALTRRQIMRDFWIGLGFALLLILGDLAFEHSPLGEQFQRWGDEIFQRSLGLEASPDVVVVNIDGIPQDKFVAGRPFGERAFVDRQALHDIVYAIATLRPRSIGIDVDMSPRYGGYVDRNNDGWFFTEMKKLRSRVPVWVGVYRDSSAPLDSWLGGPLYKSLAANVALFKDEVDRNRTVPESLGSGADCGPSLSAAVAGITVKCDTHSSFLTLLEPETHWHLGRFRGQEYVVNYSALSTIAILDAQAASDVEHQGRRIEGKAVLLGDVGSDSSGEVADHCNVPSSNDAVACVLVHASGAYTLMQARLYRLTPQARILVDLILTALVLGAVACLRWYYASRTKARVAKERLYNTGFIALAAGVLLLCGFLSRMTHVVWDDYILVVLVLLLHTSLERWLGRFVTWARANLPKFVFEEQTPS